MSVMNLNDEQRFALSLSSPIIATGGSPTFDLIEYEPKTRVLEILESWWDIHNLEDLERDLLWLTKEGGHSIVYARYYAKLNEMLYLDRKSFINDLEDPSEALRYRIVNENLHSIDSSSIRAFDIARWHFLLRSGCAMGWLSEEEYWERSVENTRDYMISERWVNHVFYLYSYYVGRVFALKLGDDGISDSMRIARKLFTDTNSPFLSWAPWPGQELNQEEYYG